MAQESLGIMLAMNNNFDQSIFHLKKAVSLNPDDESAQKNLQMALKLKNQKSSVKETLPQKTKRFSELKTAIEKNPYDPNLRLHLAHALYQVNDLHGALLTAENALALDPFHVPALAMLAQLYSESGDQENAEKMLLRAVQLESTNLQLYYSGAAMFSVAGKTDRATEWLIMAIEKGYDQWNRIQKDPALKNLRNSEYYEKIREKFPRAYK